MTLYRTISIEMQPNNLILEHIQTSKLSTSHPCQFQTVENPVREVMKFIFCLLFLIASISPSFADQSLGVTNLDVPRGDRDRPLQLSLWYPGNSGTPLIVAGNAVFLGTAAVRNAPVAGQQLPLVLISHGGLRSAADTGAWLSAKLAEYGFLAVEINGPRPDTAKQAVNELWHRPNDVSRALDAILSDPDWSSHVDQKRISVVGFALGGTAALMLAGGAFETQSFIQSCDAPDGGPDCAWYRAQNVSPGTVDVEELAVPRHDPRVSSVVAIAPEYFDAFSDGLQSIDMPTLLVSLDSNNGPHAPAPTDVVAQTTIPNASIFDGFQACTPAGPKILADDDGDPALCGISAELRRSVHSEISNIILSFLTEGHTE